MKIEQTNTQSIPALLRNACGVDAQETKSLCCEAAGIIDPISATAEALIPHEKLREAASVDAALIAQDRPPAQPVVGYKPLSQPDERAEYEKEFPIPEGLQYCANRDTYIRAAGSSTSDKFAREHYAYRAGYASWTRRACKQSQAEAGGELPPDNDATVAALRFALENLHGYDAIDFLRCWNEGDFDVVRETWPEAPEEVFIGADPLYRPSNAQEASA
ncbi:hypothetical protein [Pseudomonas chlororaphis]|uniref:hypothetical protein n=1 Tax=Pseudomonas chlororaphis TaxID=587753 RepID=UPI00160C245A|nr:hypothetical protein [Pseudomonas chlororaphis]